MTDLHRGEHLIAFALEHPWAITPPMLRIVADVLARHLAGEPTDPAALAAALVARANHAPGPHGQSRNGGAVALIPVYGVIAPRMNLVSEVSGGTTFETLTAQLRAAVADPRFTKIVFDVDSPGGSVAGASEFSREVVAARMKKPVIAIANHTMASAAYWAMAGAAEIVATPSAMVGAIGVYTIHDDYSDALAKLGVKRSVISAGKYKAEGADGGPLSPEARAHIQQLVSTFYGRFVADVARGRGVSATAVRDGYGQGRLLDSQSALTAGLVTRIATLDEVLAPMSDGAVRAALEPHRDALARASMAMRRQELDALARSRRLH